MTKLLESCTQSVGKAAVATTTHLHLLYLMITFTLLSTQCYGQSIQSEGVVEQPAISTFSLSDNNQTSQLSNDIRVSIEVSPIKQESNNNYVAANTPIKIEAKLSSIVSNVSDISYEWSTKDGPIKADKHASSLTHQFTKSNVNDFIEVKVIDGKTNSTGEAKVEIIVKSSLMVADPKGKFFLEKGELLDINLIYSGSPPFKYCYKFCSDYDFLPCNICFPYYETSNTTIPIVHYLHYVGNYTLMFKIENIMNYEERHYVIKIIDTTRPKSNLPIAPIVSTILAVCILITGVALHLKFKDTSYATETANFDFFHDDDEEEWEQELSLIQRIRYLFCGLEQEEVNETRYLFQKSPSNMTRNSDAHSNISQ